MALGGLRLRQLVRKMDGFNSGIPKVFNMSVTDSSGGASRDPDQSEVNDEPEVIHEPGLWRENGWTAFVLKNEDDDGWAVSMTRQGESEPALVGPWTMGRDKKSPKPLSSDAFRTLVKTASEVIRRHEQQLHAQLHRSVTVSMENGPVTVTLDIVPDEDNPHAFLAATDADGEELARLQVPPTFRLTTATAAAWIEGGYRKPR